MPEQDTIENVLSLVLPTYNEAENLPVLLPKITEVLKAVPHEIIIVDDDSPDRTWEAAEKLKSHFPRLRVIRRRGKRGLSSAVVDGFAVAHGNVLMVMDSDGQHDPDLLRRLYKAVQDGAGVALGSRYMPGGSVGDWVRDRRIISRMGTHLANAVCRVKASDPLGGFFAIDRALYKKIAHKLHPTGFKILLEVLAAVPAGTRIAEIPLVFQARMKGRSKLSPRVHAQFFGQILRLGLRRHLPVMFLIAMIVPSTLLLPRAWALRELYVSPQTRSRAESVLRWAEINEGWVLSDYRITIVRPDELVLKRTPHLRRSVWPQPCLLTFEDPPFATCSES